MRNRASQSIKPNFYTFQSRLEKLNLDIDGLFKELRINQKDLSSKKAGISMPRYLELLNLAAEQSQESSLGLSLALSGDLSDLGVMGYMLFNAPTFGKCLDLLARYLQLVSPGARSGVLEQGDVCILTYEIQGFTPQQSRVDVEMSLMQFVQMVRELLGLDGWCSDKAFVQHSKPKGKMSQYKNLAKEMVFNHHFNGVSFPKEFLFYPINHADPKLLKILENQVQESINQFQVKNSLLDRITLLISTSLGKTEVSADKIASHLGMSRRTLHRRLCDAGTSFSQIRDQVVSQLAKEVLSTTSVSVTELALQLGYSDASAFDKAFKRLTGLSPLEYSKKHTNQQ